MRHAHTRAATAAALALAAVTVLPAAHAAPTAGGAVLRVPAGQSIQAALDTARPGDTVELGPGTHTGGVEIATSGVTLRGSGPGTVLEPGAPGRCAASGDGVCLTGAGAAPLTGVRVADLTVRGFPGAGIHAAHTTGLQVTGTWATGNGTHGISVEYSTGTRVVGNTTSENPQAGVFIAEGDADGTVVAGNTITGNRTGMNVRRARHLSVEHNRFTGNCAGMFVVGDENTPPAGSLAIRANTFAENNRYCPPTARLAHIQGSGVVLTGATEVTVADNLFRGHRGDSPMSGGVVFAPSFVGVPSSGHVVRGNVFLANDPADIAVRDSGTGNTFTGNTCSVSEPATLC